MNAEMSVIYVNLVMQVGCKNLLLMDETIRINRWAQNMLVTCSELLLRMMLREFMNKNSASLWIMDFLYKELNECWCRLGAFFTAM